MLIALARGGSKPARLYALAAALSLALSVTGCAKKHGDAIVLSKEHIPPKPQPTRDDPKAMADEVWVVHLKMTNGGRLFDLWPEPARWNQIKPGDLVGVTYRQGEYTGIVWYTSFDR